MTRYVKSETGGIHSVDDDHFDYYLHTATNQNGNTYMLPGFTEINEAQARKGNPQLFGAADPQVTFTDDELVRAAQRKRTLEELFPERKTIKE